MTIESGHPYEILDVFTDRPLEGNPLAVFTEGESIPSRLMQAAAREMNLSETAFVLPGDGEVDAEVRIFTPHAEIPFAGHPVLGAAHVVGAKHDLATVRLRTAAGVIPVRLTREHGEIVFGEMDQPLPTVAPYRHAEDVLAALGLDYSPLPIEVYGNGLEHAIVAIENPSRVSALTPDPTALRALGSVGVVCFAPQEDESTVRVRSRVFHFGLGVPEDPATGSAAGPTACHMVRHGWLEPGQEVSIAQGVEIQRPSTLIARVDGTPERPERVVVGGSAVLVARGSFRLQ